MKFYKEKVSKKMKYRFTISNFLLALNLGSIWRKCVRLHTPVFYAYRRAQPAWTPSGCKAHLSEYKVKRFKVSLLVHWLNVY
jgi:hypothetical protein